MTRRIDALALLVITFAALSAKARAADRPSSIPDFLTNLPGPIGNPEGLFMSMGAGQAGGPLFPPPFLLPVNEEGGRGRDQQRSGGTLRDMMAPVDPDQKAAAGAARGVVASSLLLTSGICITVGGALGTASSGLGAALGAVNGVSGQINLGLTYAKAALSMREELGKNRDAYAKALDNLAGALPDALDRAAALRQSAYQAGGLLSQLSTYRAQLVAARANMARIRSVAQAVSGRGAAAA